MPLTALIRSLICAAAFAIAAALAPVATAGDLEITTAENWQETPFLWAGKTLEQLKPSIAENVLPKYGALRFEYPSAEVCLTSSNENPDIQTRDLIWYELETDEAVEMCLFRVFTALGDLADIEFWLKIQGFGSRFEYDDTNLGFLFGVEDERITRLSMTWRTSEQGALFGVTEKQRRKQVRRVLKHDVSVTTTASGRVLSVRIYGSSAIWRK